MDIDSYCDPCSGDEKSLPAIRFCSDCEERLCKDCVEYHKKFKATKSHHLMDLTSIGQTNIPKTKKFCEVHPDIPLDFYCTQHDIVCCRACIPSDHQSCVSRIYVYNIYQDNLTDNITLSLPSEPYGISILTGTDKAVVTLPCVSYLQFIDTRNLNMGKTIEVGKGCYGITTSDNFLAVDGTVVYQYRVSEESGIAVDAHGNVYVSEENKSEIHRLLPDGGFRDVILTRKDGIAKPYAITPLVVANLRSNNNRFKRLKLVFKIDANGQYNNIYDMYMDSGITYNMNDNAAQTHNCSNGKHFKSDIINHWKDIDIDHVKLVVYQDGIEKAFLHFDGAGTDKINWFSQEGLLNSSYSDLKTASPDVNGYHFDVEGLVEVNILGNY
ncbi:unnamed protein product [Mytilus edulis]|uniref:B box-type domain-containing protein n=1 Tax=Mytilus edulis TaxID=6550 RepID=A0A8S3S462_MYTED|nr:unnamed protein product [Mytilus edulis]